MNQPKDSATRRADRAVTKATPGDWKALAERARRYASHFLSCRGPECTCGLADLYADFDRLTAAHREESAAQTPSQRMAAAGFKRKPSHRALPSDESPAQEAPATAATESRNEGAQSWICRECAQTNSAWATQCGRCELPRDTGLTGKLLAAAQPLKSPDPVTSVSDVTDADVEAACRAFYGEKWWPESTRNESPKRWMRAALEAANRQRSHGRGEESLSDPHDDTTAAACAAATISRLLAQGKMTSEAGNEIIAKLRAWAAQRNGGQRGEPVAMRDALISCARIFRWYEDIHNGKSDAEKAKRNREMAELCENALAASPDTAQPSASGRVPEGWVLVPKEPTAAMLKAARLHMAMTAKDTWELMVAAAPRVSDAEGDSK